MRKFFCLVIWIFSLNCFAIEGGSISDERYLATIVYKDLPFVNEPIGIACSATLVHSDWLLTTGSCLRYLKHTESGFEFLFYKPSELSVYMAGDRIPLLPPFSNNAENRISDIFIHPGFQLNFIGPESDIFYENDIALLRLRTPSASTAIDLYPGSDLLRSASGLAIGWDLYFPPSSIYNTLPFYLPATTSSQYNTEACPAEIEPYSICAGLQRQSGYTVHKDEGGPLTFFDGSQDVLIGVLSQTAYDEPMDDIYTRISSVREFIENTILNYVPDDGLCFPVKNSQGSVSIICI